MTVNPADSAILGDLFGTAAMREIFADGGRLRCMLAVEAALARAEARLGLIPAEAAAAIGRAARPENLDVAALAASTRAVGYPVVGLTRALERAAGPEAARWVHWGATTQDILDTALVLQMREGLGLLRGDLAATAAALVGLAVTHRDTPMAGRSHLQHALPITFGAKCAVWANPLLDDLDRLEAAAGRALKLQFGGAVGTLASLGTSGRAVVEALAAELDLAVPDAPWHASRDGLAEAAAALGILAGNLAKLATDLILLMQTEVAEAAEPHQPGRGGSSTMPQKRNPIACEYVLAAARGVHALVPLLLGAMAHDHERATGPWQAEQLALPQIFVLASGALAHARFLAEGLTVDPARMRANLGASGGLIVAEAAMMALAGRMGRGAAHHAVQHACDRALAEGLPLAEALAADPQVARHLDAARIAALLEPSAYVGEAGAIVDRVAARAARRLCRA